MTGLTRTKDYSDDIRILAQHSEVANKYYHKCSNYAVYPVIDCEDYESDYYFHPSPHCGSIIDYNLFGIEDSPLIWIEGFSEYYMSDELYDIDENDMKKFDLNIDNAVLVIGVDEGWLQSKLIVFNSKDIKPEDSNTCIYDLSIDISPVIVTKKGEYKRDIYRGDRFVVYESGSDNVIDDANGYGFTTAQAAFKRYQYLKKHQKLADQ